MWSPKVQGFSACLHLKNHPVAVIGIPFSGRLATIFAKLEPLDFDTRHVLQAKAQATSHSNLSNLRQSTTAE
jgi:hypothetical protein